MAGLFCQLFCMSFLAGTAAIGAKTGDVFAIAAAAFGLDKDQFIESTYGGGTTWLRSMILRETTEKMEKLRNAHIKASSFLDLLLNSAYQAATKEKTPNQAYDVVNGAYNRLTTDDKKALLDTFPKLKEIFSENVEVKPEGDDSYKSVDNKEQNKSVDNKEQKSLEDLIPILGCIRNVSSNLLAYIEAYKEGIPFTAKDLKVVFEAYKTAVHTLKKPAMAARLELSDVNTLTKGFETFGELAISRGLMTKMELHVLKKTIESKLETKSGINDKLDALYNIIKHYPVKINP